MNSRRILIVDDDKDIREALLDTLIDEGHQAVAVADGPAALRYLRMQPKPPCLVFLDWNMAPMNGGEVMREIRDDPLLAPHRVVLLTADARLEEKAATPGFVGVLKKPLSVDELMEYVERHCA